MKGKKRLLNILLAIFITFSSVSLFSNEKKEDIFIIKKDYIVKGHLSKNITIVGGSVVVDGELDGDIVAIWSSVTLKKGSRVNGDVVILVGKIKKEEGSVVGGHIFTIMGKEDKSFSPKNIFKSRFKKGGEIGFSIGVVFLWFIISYVILKIYKPGIITLVSTLRKEPLKSFGYGLLAFFLVISFFIIFIVLSIFIIGIPFLFLLILIIMVVKVLERVVAIYFLGEIIQEGIRAKKDISLILILGTILFFLVKFSGILGALLASILDIIAIGTILINHRMFLKK